MKNRKSSIAGIEANIVVLICYLGALFLSWFYDTKILAWLLPLIIYIIEKDNEFRKKQSAQACILYFCYTIINLIIMFVSIHYFNIQNIYTFNLTNFSGSLLMASILIMIAMSILVLVTIITVIVVSKVWNYEDYELPFIKKYINKFRKFIDKIINDNNKENKEYDENNDIILSGEIKDEDEIKIEDDTEIIIEKEIEDTNKTKKKNKEKKI